MKNTLKGNAGTMNTENKNVHTYWRNADVMVTVQAPNAWQAEQLLKDMALEHGAYEVCTGTCSGREVVQAFFWHDDKADTYAAEAVTYTNQQTWKDSISDEEAAELKFVL